MTGRGARALAFGLLAAVLAATAGRTDAAPRDLREQIRLLAEAERVAVQGLERLGDEPAVAAPAGDLRARFRALLSEYNYVVTGGGPGGVAAIRIVGRQASAGTDAALALRQHTVRTTRRGAHHVVEAMLVGPNGATFDYPLILDTGATTIVLPASAIERAGFAENELQHARANSVAGVVGVRIGRLRSVRVGSAQVEDVEVSFIDDDVLGGHGLLGMSYLGRFRVTVDDSRNHLILVHE
jgi:aspartyl protease family protein